MVHIDLIGFFLPCVLLLEGWSLIVCVWSRDLCLLLFVVVALNKAESIQHTQLQKVSNHNVEIGMYNPSSKLRSRWSNSLRKLLRYFV